MVLDGSVSRRHRWPTRPWSGDAFERTLGNFVTTRCGPSCALADTAAAIESTRRSLEEKPVEVKTGAGTRTLTSDLFDYGLATALYDTSTWGPTAKAIKNIRSGGAKTILALVDRQTGRQADGSYDNSSDAQTMVNCADQNDHLTEEQARVEEEKIRAAAPTFGGLLGAGLTGCNDWPAPAEPTPAPSAVGAPPILVIGTVGDPATPYEWAQEMSALTGGVLLTTKATATPFLGAVPASRTPVRPPRRPHPAAVGTGAAQSTGGGFGGTRMRSSG